MQASVITCSHPHRAAPLPALVCAVHARDPEMWRHGCGLQPAEAQARDPVCVSRVPAAVHGTNPGGSCIQRAERARWAGSGSAWDGPYWPSLCLPGLEDTGQPEEKKVFYDNATEKEEEEVATGSCPLAGGGGGREKGAVSLGDSSLLSRWARSRRTMRLAQLGTDDPVTLGKSFSLSESQFPLVHIGGGHWIIIY